MDLDEIVDRLFGLPLEEFTRARDEAADELRKAGRRDQAAEVKALRKPTAAAGAVNRLVHEHRRDVDAFLSAAAALRDAQVAGKGDLAEATQAQRRALDGLVRAGGEAVRQSLLAAAVDDDAARELLAARLERELEPRGFGSLLAHAAPAAAARAKRPAAAAAPDDHAARAKLAGAREALSAAESEAHQAERRWTQARKDLERAQAAVDKAQRELDQLHTG
jgi:hypothetical protein